MKKFNLCNPTVSILAILIFALTAHAAPGDLDLSFAGTGKVRLGFNNGYDSARAAAQQVDGKLVVAGVCFDGSNDGLIVARFNPNGSLDTSFGSSGKTVIPLVTAVNEQLKVTALQIQTDGKIVVAATALRDFVVTRFNTDGSPDTTFDGDGIVSTHISSYDEAAAMVLQRDGKIIVVGHALSSATNYDFAVLRYNTNGSLDTTFNGSGKVVTALSSLTDQAKGVTLQPDGKILVAGYSGQDAAVVRYTTTGALDPTFDGDGVVTTQIGDGTSGIRSIAFEKGNGLRTNPDRIIVAGEAKKSDRLVYFVASYFTAGGLQTNFGTNGTAIYDVSPYNCYIWGMLIVPVADQPDKIVIGGINGGYPSGTGPLGTDMIVLRLNAGGSLDTSFDGDGVALIAYDGDEYAYGLTYHLGKVLLLGQKNGNYCLVRLNANGSLDPTFSGGTIIVDLGDGYAEGRATAIQTDGKIIVAGTSYSGLTVTRFNTNGTLDASFDGNGKAITSDDYSRGNAVAIQPDGKIVAAGTRSNNAFFVARFKSNGLPDTTFSGDGILTTVFGTSASGNAVGLQADGKIVVAGSFNGNFVLTRYTATGALDTSFDGDGIVTTAASGAATAMAIQADGKIVVAGSSRVGTSDNDFAVFRYNSNGSLDTSFDGDGKVTTHIGSNDQGNAMSIQPDGKIVLAGSAYITGGTYDFALVRYNPDGSLDTTFDGDGKITTPIGTNTDDANALTIQPDGKILVAGYSYSATLEDDFAVVRYNANGSLDTSFWSSTGFFGNDGKVFVDFNRGDDRAFGITLDSAGRPVIVGSGAGLFGVVRLQGDSGASGFQSFGASGDWLTPNAFVP